MNRETDNTFIALFAAITAALAVWLAISFAGWFIIVGGEFDGAKGIFKADLFAKLPTRMQTPEARNLTAWRTQHADDERLKTLTLARNGAAILVAVVTFFLLKTRIDATGNDQHLRGRRLLQGSTARREFARTSKQEATVSGVGIAIHPSLSPLSLDRETRHFLIFGGVGGGKTQTILPLIQAAQARRDRCLIFDNKGDFSAKLQGMILAPWDTRSPIWDIATDVQTASAAAEFAALIVPEGESNPMWHSAARQVLTGCLIALQARNGAGSWGFRDLANMLSSTPETLLETMKEFHPEAIKTVEFNNVTTTGILINLMSSLSAIFELAHAWPHPTPGKCFSILRWIDGDFPEIRTVLLPGNGQFKTLAQGFARSIIGLSSQHINSPNVGESRARKLWFFLDEMPQLGKIEAIFPLVEVGRSKGIRVVIGLQDVAQLRHIYGHDMADAACSMVGTHIVARVSAGETAEFIAEKLIGDREIRRLEESRTTGTGAPASMFSPGGTRNVALKVHREPVMLPSQLQSQLGPIDKGVNVLFLGYADALILTIPFTSLPDRRKACLAADWTRRPAVQPKAAVIEEPTTQPEQEKEVEVVEVKTAPVIVPSTAVSVIAEVADAGSDLAEKGVSLAAEHLAAVAVPGGGLMLNPPASE
ncbi:MAG: type IV secretion system DNA-binding domain-containing protein [Sulfurisoma sp.]|nr:type IV secretion system DNA-binding domain-containing protein [Sulfurisoma sp.]